MATNRTKATSSKAKSPSKASDTKAANIASGRGLKSGGATRVKHEGSEPGQETNPGSTTGQTPQQTRQAAEAAAAKANDPTAARARAAKAATREMKTADKLVAEAHQRALDTVAKNNGTTVEKQRAAAQKAADAGDRSDTDEQHTSPLSADLPQETVVPSEMALRAALRDGRVNDLSAAFAPSGINPPHTTDMVAAIGTGPYGDAGPSGAGEAGIGLPARRGSATQ